MILSKFSCTQHSTNKFVSAFVCKNFPVVANIARTQWHLRLVNYVFSSFASLKIALFIQYLSNKQRLRNFRSLCCVLIAEQQRILICINRYRSLLFYCSCEHLFRQVVEQISLYCSLYRACAEFGVKTSLCNEFYCIVCNL